MSNLIIMVTAGDSLTGCAGDYPYLYLNITPHGDCASTSAQQSANYTPSAFFMVHQNLALAGTRIADQNTNATTLADPLLASRSAVNSVSSGSSIVPTRKYVYSLLTGTNDGVIIGGSVPTFVAAVSAHCLARKAAGWDRVMLGTVLPVVISGTPMTEPNRALYNSTIKAPGWAANNGVDAIFDFAADPIMGNFANASNTLYYSDGLHPTALGQSILAPIWGATLTSVVNALG